MAVTLTIDLSDQEQAKLLEIAAIVAPGATSAQVKTWAEKTAKRALRQAVQLELHDHQMRSMQTAWPDAPIEVPPAQGG